MVKFGKTRLVHTVVVPILLLVPSPRYQNPSLPPATDLPVYADRELILKLVRPGAIMIMATADFNGDGFIDIVVTRLRFGTSETFEVGILLNNGQGGFRDATRTIFSGPVPQVQFAMAVIVADFNGDGRPDFYIPDFGQDPAGPGPTPGHQNTLVLSTAEGKLVDATANLPQQSDPTGSATAADIDGNGTIDIFVGNGRGNFREILIPPQILLNDGSGRFTICEGCLPAEVTDYSRNPFLNNATLLVDVNNDGFPDLILVGTEFTQTLVLLNDGTGRFSVFSQAPWPPAPFNNAQTGIASADINPDGFADLLIVFDKRDPFWNLSGQYVQILINNGDGTFRDETATRLPQADNDNTNLEYIQLLDINGDGHLDIATILRGGFDGSPPFYLNDGNGFFTPVPLGAGKVMNRWVAVDVDGDGGRDFVTSFGDGIDPETGQFSEFHYLVRDIGPVLPPGNPRGVSATRDRFADKVRVSWDYVWGAARYEVWRSTSPGAPGSLVATTTKTMLDDTTVTPGVTYYYSVRAVNAAGASAFGYPTLQNPNLALSLNQASFRPGETLTITAQVTPGATPTPVDAYVAIAPPGGTLLFLQGGGNFTTDLRPIVTNWTAAPFRGEIFRYTFGGGEPGGNYTWYAAFTEPGTLNFIGGIVQAPFSFSP